MLDLLDDYRKEIELIDRRLIALFEQRMDFVLEIAEIKKKHHLQVLQKSREEQVIENALANLNNKEYKQYVTDFIIQIMRISRDMQKQQMQYAHRCKEPLNTENICKAVGFQGVSGSFSEEALIQYFGEDVCQKAYKEFEDVFVALKNNEIRCGILPIDNSTTGAVSIVYDLLEKYGYYIIGEVYIPVCQHLMGVTGASLDCIDEVYSHTQGFEQSTEFLTKHKHLRLIPYHNTAVSAKYVSQIKDMTKAAIASRRAAQIYNLNIIEENIQNKNNNATRFIIVSKDLFANEQANKVSVVFSMDHKAGTLYNLLSFFAENRLNLVKIESRPKCDNPWTYYLYADFEGNINNENTKKALDQIQKASAYLRILGSYPAADSN